MSTSTTVGDSAVGPVSQLPDVEADQTWPPICSMLKTQPRG